MLGQCDRDVSAKVRLDDRNVLSLLGHDLAAEVMLSGLDQVSQRFLVRFAAVYCKSRYTSCMFPTVRPHAFPRRRQSLRVLIGRLIRAPRGRGRRRWLLGRRTAVRGPRGRAHHDCMGTALQLRLRTKA